MTGLQDRYNRVMDRLRTSVTGKCNMRRVYCMPQGGMAPARHSDILRYEEIIRISGIAAGPGTWKMRLTWADRCQR